MANRSPLSPRSSSLRLAGPASRSFFTPILAAPSAPPQPCRATSYRSIRSCWLAPHPPRYAASGELLAARRSRRAARRLFRLLGQQRHDKYAASGPRGGPGHEDCPSSIARVSRPVRRATGPARPRLAHVHGEVRARRLERGRVRRSGAVRPHDLGRGLARAGGADVRVGVFFFFPGPPPPPPTTTATPFFAAGGLPRGGRIDRGGPRMGRDSRPAPRLEGSTSRVRSATRWA